jgi:hypothetical protein
MSRLVVSLSVVLAAASICCAARHHMIETQGQSYTRAFARQAPVRDRIVGPTGGLDPQEASIIADVYRQSLVPKKVKVSEEPVILVAPPSRQGTTHALPAPSVPKER